MTIQTPSFMSQAKCKGKDTNFFFPETPGETTHAMKFCQDCPVKFPCGQYALDNNIMHGIWGGMSIRQRMKIKKELKTISQ